VILAHDSYGKERVRLVKVARRADRHELRDFTVGIRFEGEYAAVYAAGDNRACLPTDTMKNTVYALARQHSLEEVERFGVLLAEHFVRGPAGVAPGDAAAGGPAPARVTVEIAERPWTRIVVAGRAHEHAFTRAADGAERVARVTAERGGVVVESGIEGLLVLKTAGSAFEGFLRDRYTTLAETADRIFATALSARWRYARADVAYNSLWHGVRQLILETFADHDSRSVQHTLYAIGRAVLEECPDVAEIRLSLPNKHHLLANLAPLGLDNPNEIFVPTDEPHGLIEATLRRA
jgi:urate oxidase